MDKRFSAEELSLAGDRFLGRPYSEMDCQAFVERCLACVGCSLDLKGSNAWFRKCTEEGWTGSPEECVRVFGSIPKGAFLFIHAFDGGEERRGYHDGKGNASHIGIRTGRGKGAIHSSASRGCVAESEFHDKTVRNGGWNTVGLWNRMDYGDAVNRKLDASWNREDDTAPAEVPAESVLPENGTEEGMPMKATVTSPNGRPVNLRKKPDRLAALVDRFQVGTDAEVLECGPVWSRIRVKGKTGWMMTEFLETEEAESAEPEEKDTPDVSYCVTIFGLDLTQARALVNNYPNNSMMERSVG